MMRNEKRANIRMILGEKVQADLYLCLRVSQISCNDNVS